MSRYAVCAVGDGQVLPIQGADGRRLEFEKYGIASTVASKLSATKFRGSNLVGRVIDTENGEPVAHDWDCWLITQLEREHGVGGPIDQAIPNLLRSQAVGIRAAITASPLIGQHDWALLVVDVLYWTDEVSHAVDRDRVLSGRDETRTSGLPYLVEVLSVEALSQGFDVEVPLGGAVVVALDGVHVVEGATGGSPRVVRSMRLPPLLSLRERFPGMV